MNDAVSKLVDGALERWRATGSEPPPQKRRYSTSEQVSCEKRVDEYLSRIDQQLRNPRRKDAARIAIERTMPFVVRIANISMDLYDSQIDALLCGSFSEISMELARWARELDPKVTLADILQAARNAWTAAGLQLLFGRPIRLTPSIFGYSMLYPYSDNVLDDAGIDPPSKVRFHERFRRRLRGEHLDSESDREVTIFALIELIELEYSRSSNPDVFSALLAIHAAQTQSLLQQHSACDLERVSIEKGGTSVLADAWLAAGQLSDAEAEFAFEWGVLLQFADDLQDLQEDLRSGSRTLFTESAARVPLDFLTNRLLNFAVAVKASMQGLPHCTVALAELLNRSLNSMLLRSVAANRTFYSPQFLAELETRSPLRFDFLEQRQRWLDERGDSCKRLFELFIRTEASTTSSLSAVTQ